MKVESIALSWFRGAGEAVSLDPHTRSMVVYGANGAGKSSFADAFEYMVSNGKIKHLAHEYSGVHQQRGLRNTHAPQGMEAKITLHFQNQAWMSACIRPDGVVKFQCHPLNITSDVQSWDLARFILRQDEVAHFIHATKSEKYSVLLPLLGLETLEYSANNLRAVYKAIEDRGKLEFQKSQLKEKTETILKYLPDLSQAAIDQALFPLVQTYLTNVETESQAVLLEEVARAIETSIGQTEPQQRRFFILQQIQQLGLGERLSRLRQAERHSFEAADEVIDRQIAVLEAAEDFLENINDDPASIECPACGRAIQTLEFTEHVRRELRQFEAAQASRKAVIQTRGAMQKGILELSNWMKNQDFHAWLEGAQQGKLKEALMRLTDLNLEQCDHPWDEGTWEVLRQDIPILVQQVDEAIRQVPPTSLELMRDQQLVKALKMIPEINHLEVLLKRSETLLGCISKAEENLRDFIKYKTLKITQAVSAEVQRLWAKLHPNEPIEKVELYIPKDADKAIDICLKFYGVDQPSPRLTLSEGHRNSLGLCIFLALVRLEADKSRPIILDDVVSSLDREHRGMLTLVLQEDFADRQVVLLTHDREWFAELRHFLSSKCWDFVALRPWVDPEHGIQWSQSKSTFGDARSLVAENPEAAGNRARAIMDTELAIIAEKLQIRMPFSRGERNDRRTCMEFIDRIVSEAKGKLQKRQDGELVKYADPISDWQSARDKLVTWGNRASHGGSLIRYEADNLIETCEKALDHFICTQCNTPVWFAEQTEKQRLQCSCGDLVWRIS